MRGIIPAGGISATNQPGGPPGPVLGIHHAQITVPEGSIPAAKAFYCGLLGLVETAKPVELANHPVFWVRVGDRNVHVNVDQQVDRFRSRAHLAYEVADLHEWEAHLTRHGIAIEQPVSFAGHQRFQIRDPFGNMVEFIQRVGD